jgi:hypothetical protein
MLTPSKILISGLVGYLKETFSRLIFPSGMFVYKPFSAILTFGSLMIRLAISYDEPITFASD